MTEETPQSESAAPTSAPAFEVVLASGSPRRRELLEQAGVKFIVHTPEAPVDESLEPDLAANPEEAAKKLAERKAGAVVQEVLAGNYTGMLIVIGADTMVVLDGKIFGKPRSLSDAKHMLRQLSGRIDEEIADYLGKGESFDKAGAYAIQGEGAALVDHYDGALDTIIGLPADRLIREFPDLLQAEVK